MLVQSLLIALATFTLTYVVLRGAEWLYHRMKHTRDWSPHWGSWLFAVLTGIYFFISYAGR
jgi:hypothetical protein